MTVLATATDALSGVQSVEFTVNGATVRPSSVTQGGPSTWSLQFVPDQKGKNPYTIEWSATDAATNVGATSVALTGVETGA